MFNLTFKQEMKMYDLIIYTCIGLIILWLILKIAGVIHSPPFITYFPHFMALAGLLTFLHKIGKYFWRLDQDIRFLKTHAVEADKKFDVLSHDFHQHLKKYHA